MSHSNPTPKRARKPYTYFNERVWARARQAYLDGDSARLVSERFGPTVYAVRRRISREGWTKRSLLVAQEAALPELDAEETAAAPSDPRAAARAALDEAVRLMRLGRTAAAMEAARVADVMARAAARLDGGSEGAVAEPEDDEAAFEAVRTKVLGDLAPLPVREGETRAGGVGG
jgi:hypothetical protein